MNEDKPFGDVIYSYTSEQAEEDGILFNVCRVNKDWEKGLFNYVTSNLMDKGYLADGKINIPNLLDLLNQSVQIVKKAKPDTFYSGTIELPSGDKQKIFIAQNETGKFTIMLPEDY